MPKDMVSWKIKLIKRALLFWGFLLKNLKQKVNVLKIIRQAMRAERKKMLSVMFFWRYKMLRLAKQSPKRAKKEASVGTRALMRILLRFSGESREIPASCSHKGSLKKRIGALIKDKMLMREPKTIKTMYFYTPAQLISQSTRLDFKRRVPLKKEVSRTSKN